MELLGFFIGVAFFIALEGFFAGSEIALLSADKGTLKAIYRKGKQKYLLHFLENPEEYITLTMLGYTISIVFAATLYTLALISMTRYFPAIEGYEVLLAETLVIFTIVFGEIIPKSFFQHHATKIAVPSLFILDKIRIPVKPILVLSKLISRFISRRFATSGKVIRRDDIIDLLRENKTFADYEGLIISNILSFKDRRAGEIVRPLYETVMISENASVNQAIEKIKESGFSRIPVYRIRVDDITGYISAYDLIGAKPGEPIKKYVKKILIFSEYTPLPDVIETFKNNKEHIGVVVDERGLIIGILTLEDILREIMGSIQTERGEEELIKEISRDRWIVDGKLEVNELTRIIGVKVPEGNYSTVGGLVSYLAGRVPDENQVFELAGYRFKVVSRTDRRVEKVMIEKEKVREEV